ncbi:hypothetical protein DFH08DRAFT_461495 [Mycena albidolilacea]|uniref:C3H1-type domain-containing protein n=1 Tax=Mycena albidolilacea TaxID=1033008 RepID=A0AAD7AEA7_9AGAR|nr:hypothetical protein DFH08DRAFT_461495 [Mycena albidolilacea]
MAICQFFQQGRCRYGTACKNDHVQAGGGGGNQTYVRPGADIPVGAFTAESIKNDLTMGKERPIWPLASYGPAKFEPTLLSGLDESPEELRLRAATAAKAGNVNEYLAYESSKMAAAEQVYTVRSRSFCCTSTINELECRTRLITLSKLLSRRQRIVEGLPLRLLILLLVLAAQRHPEPLANRPLGSQHSANRPSQLQHPRSVRRRLRNLPLGALVPSRIMPQLSGLARAQTLRLRRLARAASLLSLENRLCSVRIQEQLAALSLDNLRLARRPRLPNLHSVLPLPQANLHSVPLLPQANLHSVLPLPQTNLRSALPLQPPSSERLRDLARLRNQPGPRRLHLELADQHFRIMLAEARRQTHRHLYSARRPIQRLRFLPLLGNHPYSDSRLLAQLLQPLLHSAHPLLQQPNPHSVRPLLQPPNPRSERPLLQRHNRLLVLPPHPPSLGPLLGLAQSLSLLLVNLLLSAMEGQCFLITPAETHSPATLPMPPHLSLPLDSRRRRRIRRLRFPPLVLRNPPHLGNQQRRRSDSRLHPPSATLLLSSPPRRLAPQPSNQTHSQAPLSSPRRRLGTWRSSPPRCSVTRHSSNSSSSNQFRSLGVRSHLLPPSLQRNPPPRRRPTLRT